MLSYAIRYKFSILVAILISLLSLIPSSSFPDSSFFSIRFLDKIVHCSMYGFFVLVALIESRCHEKCLQFHLIQMALIFFMSALIEVLQATVIPTRSAEWFDLLANFVGLITGYIAYVIILKLGLLKLLKS